MILVADLSSTVNSVIPCTLHIALSPVDWMHKLWRELCCRGQEWRITKLTRCWLWLQCGNRSTSCLCPHFQISYMSVRPPSLCNTTVVSATSYLWTYSYLAYWHNRLYDAVSNTFFIYFQKNLMSNWKSYPLNAIQKYFTSPMICRHNPFHGSWL
jgi:hypothetical protein